MLAALRKLPSGGSNSTLVARTGRTVLGLTSCRAAQRSAARMTGGAVMSQITQEDALR
jgi:hypothetical protein